MAGALGLAVALVIALLVTPTAAVPAPAAVVPKADCARHDSGVQRGVCVRDARGGIYWLGTLRGYDGVEMYCIDYAFATDWGVAHHRITVDGTLPTSIGGRVGAATVAALNHVVTRHPASRVDDTTAAAIGLIIRQVMGDVRRPGGQAIPGGLTVASRVKDVGFVPDGVVRRARTLWDEARVHRGPWRLAVRIDAGPDGKVTAGERVRAVVRGTNGSGTAQAMPVSLRYRAFTGPATVALGRDGVATVPLTAPPRATSAAVTARVENAPGTRPLVIRPHNWAVNPKPGRSSAISQRGLVGTQEPTIASTSVSTVIVRSTPILRTQASAQTVVPGAAIHDTVVVSRTGGAAGSFFWSLIGPVAPGPDGRCPGVGAPEWPEAGVLASGTVATTGDGTYVTPDYVVGAADVGCLTYTESRPETPTTWPVTSPPGIAEETLLVRRPKSTPCVTTVASRQQALVGARLFDHVRVGCIGGPDRVQVRWTAHGPLAPRAGSTGDAGCDGIPPSAWLRAPVAARGAFTAIRPGTYDTVPFTVSAPGCYTFSETVAATATTLPTRTAPGIAVETALVTRPPLVQVPEVPTGPARSDSVGGWWQQVLAMLLAQAPGEGAVSQPGLSRAGTFQPTARLAPQYLDRTYRRGSEFRTTTRTARGPVAGTLRIARLRIVAAVESVPLRRGVMAIPDAPSRLGWLRGTAAAGDVVGSSVIAGHVSDRQDRPGPLAALVRIRPGDRITWTDQRGRRHDFVVRGVARHRRSSGLPGSVFRADGPHTLRLITCTSRVSGAGGFHYRDNLVVTAVEAQ